MEYGVETREASPTDRQRCPRRVVDERLSPSECTPDSASRREAMTSASFICNITASSPHHWPCLPPQPRPTDAVGSWERALKPGAWRFGQKSKLTWPDWWDVGGFSSQSLNVTEFTIMWGGTPKGHILTKKHVVLRIFRKNRFTSLVCRDLKTSKQERQLPQTNCASTTYRYRRILV